MSLLFGRWIVTFAIAALPAAGFLEAQTVPRPDPAASQPNVGQQSQKPAGKVIFERSLDADGNPVDISGPQAKPGVHAAEAPVADDLLRRSIAVSALDLDVRLHTEAQRIEVRGTVIVRNQAKTALSRIPLQISSSLSWERIRVDSRDVSFPWATLNSDADHTGQLHEAAIPLAQPLEPGGSRPIEVLYSGTIPPSAKRLIAAGTPEDSAAHSDWDMIGPDFTGLRGFGNVVWYPVASVPVILGDGARLFDEIGRQRLAAEGAAFHLKLTVEFPRGHTPTVAVVNGSALKLAVTDPGSMHADVPALATADTGLETLGFESPSLFVAVRSAHPGTHMTVYSAGEDEAAAGSWIEAATSVAPMIEHWLGEKPRAELSVLDLPDADDVPWESGTLLAIPVENRRAELIDAVLSHAMTHAWMAPRPYWLNEGAANFMGALWEDHQHQHDRALASLESGRQALSIEEPPSPGESVGQPLAQATSPVYYRTKAAYVLWMLRELVGDDVLAAALRASNADSKPGADPDRAFPAELRARAPGHDLSWLFRDWIDADRGLPDLSVDKVFPNAVQSGNWLVSVTISNSGFATAEVPVTVRSATNSTTERVLVPGRGTVTPRLLVQGKPTTVEVNDGSVPETVATVHVMHLDQTAGSEAPPAAQP